MTKRCKAAEQAATRRKNYFASPARGYPSQANQSKKTWPDFSSFPIRISNTRPLEADAKKIDHGVGSGGHRTCRHAGIIARGSKGPWI
jgi:hypothetical protein